LKIAAGRQSSVVSKKQKTLCRKVPALCGITRISQLAALSYFHAWWRAARRMRVYFENSPNASRQPIFSSIFVGNRELSRPRRFAFHLNTCPLAHLLTKKVSLPKSENLETIPCLFVYFTSENENLTLKSISKFNSHSAFMQF